MCKQYLLAGNSIEVLKTFERSSVDLVVTDPPYLVNYRDRSGRSLLNDDDADGVLPIYDELYRVLKNNSYCITFLGWQALHQFSDAWHSAGFACVGHIVFAKRYVSSRGHTARQHESAFVLTKSNPPKPVSPIRDIQPWHYSGNRLHPTEKSPLTLKPLIKAYSKPGYWVLDPFAGSASTLIAASSVNRNGVGIELDPHYRGLAHERLLRLNRSTEMAA